MLCLRLDNLNAWCRASYDLLCESNHSAESNPSHIRLFIVVICYLNKFNTILINYIDKIKLILY